MKLPCYVASLIRKYELQKFYDLHICPAFCIDTLHKYHIDRPADITCSPSQEPGTLTFKRARKGAMLQTQNYCDILKADNAQKERKP